MAYSRDNRGRIIGVDVTPANGSATTLISNVDYLPFGPVGMITWGDQSTLARRYDQNYWIDQIESSQPEGLVLEFSEDVVGNIVSLSDTLAPVVPDDSYGYDDLYRLTTQNASGTGVTQFGYDATGNRSSVTTSASTTAYTYPAGSHRLQSVGASARGYDANGNTTAMNSKALSYDERNRLAVVDLGFSGSVESRYNARGERVVRMHNSFGVVTETRYVYDEGGRLLLELPSKKGASPTEVVWLDDLPVGLVDPNGEVRHIEPDHLGSPRKVIEPSRGTALWDWPILGNAFGTAAANDDADGDGNATALNLRFPGQQYDSATGLHYNYFRDYDPSTGRYVESDPIGLKGGVSTFGYVEGNPVRAIDPRGLVDPGDEHGNGIYRFPRDGNGVPIPPKPPEDCRLVWGYSFVGVSVAGEIPDGAAEISENGLWDVGVSVSICCKPERKCGVSDVGGGGNDEGPDSLAFGLGRRLGMEIGKDEVCINFGLGVGPPVNWGYDQN